MDVAHARWLMASCDWANTRYVDALSPLTREQLTRPIPSSFPSLLATLAHLVVVEWVWLRRWQGESPDAAPAWHDAPRIDLLRDELERLHRERDAFLGALGPDGLAHAVRFRYVGGRTGEKALGLLIHHVANHSSFHRGQLATMMRQVGATPPAVDLDDCPLPAPF